MESVEEILGKLGIESVSQMDINECYTIQAPGFEDLTIEKVANFEIIVAHHYKQRGDLMCDPEVVFRIEEDNKWIPIEYTQHPVSYERCDRGLKISGFLKKWDENLRKQGFVEAAGDRKRISKV